MATQNKHNPAGIHRRKDGVLVNKYGMPVEVDWDSFEKNRTKVRNPLYKAVKKKSEADKVVESMLDI